MPARRTRRFSSQSDGGKTWKELAGLRSAKGHLWQPGAGGMCLHTIVLDPSQSRADLCRHLGCGRVPERRWRQDLAADQRGLEIEI